MTQAVRIASRTGRPRRVNGSGKTTSRANRSLALASNMGEGCPSQDEGAWRAHRFLTSRQAALQRSTTICSATDAVMAAETATALGSRLARVQRVRRARLRFALVATLAAAALVAGILQADVFAFLTKDRGLEGSLVTRASGLRSAQLQQAAPASAPQTRSLENEARSEALAHEPAETRRLVDELNLQLATQAAKTAPLLEQGRDKEAPIIRDQTAARQATMEGAEQYRQELQEERARSVALASELATSRTVIESMTMLLQETEQQIAELGSSQQLERKVRDPGKGLDAAPQAMTSGAEQRRALKKARASAAALASELATRAKDTSQSARLIARASALLGQRNIGAARIVLERVAETGNAKANFMLAETYDPAVLAAWGAFGTRGEAAKAREFYAGARRRHSGGEGSI